MTGSPAGRVVVLDDDPTGTQTVSGLPIVLSPDVATLRRVAQRTEGPLWVLTNTRALGRNQAIDMLTSVVGNVHAALGRDIRLVLRGDSTLRGHVLEEIDAISSPGAVALFVPAFVEQGRVTLGGVHYVLVDGIHVPVATTEYARDATFGYRSSNLVDWVHDREPSRPSVSVPLDELRSSGADGLRAVLAAAADRSIVIPDVETVEDLRVIRDAWVATNDEGRQVVLRCGSSLASVVTGSRPAAIPAPAVAGAVLVVCASHTSGATAQLARLVERPDIVAFEIDAATLNAQPDVAHRRAGALANDVDQALRSARVVVLSTPRDVDTSDVDVHVGAAVMDIVVGVVAGIGTTLGAVVTKGGITSARVARDGLHAPTATVCGQARPGVPLWALDLPGGATLTHVVVPGNIGAPDTLADIVADLTRPPDPPGGG